MAPEVCANCGADIPRWIRENEKGAHGSDDNASQGKDDVVEPRFNHLLEARWERVGSVPGDGDASSKNSRTDRDDMGPRPGAKLLSAKASGHPHLAGASG